MSGKLSTWLPPLPGELSASLSRVGHAPCSMPKARFSSLDVAAIVSSLRSTVLGYRISNVYDINPRTYLLKLAKALAT